MPKDVLATPPRAKAHEPYPTPQSQVKHEDGDRRIRASSPLPAVGPSALVPGHHQAVKGEPSDAENLSDDDEESPGEESPKKTTSEGSVKPQVEEQPVLREAWWDYPMPALDPPFDVWEDELLSDVPKVVIRDIIRRYGMSIFNNWAFEEALRASGAIVNGEKGGLVEGNIPAAKSFKFVDEFPTGWKVPVGAERFMWYRGSLPVWISTLDVKGYFGMELETLEAAWAERAVIKVASRTVDYTEKWDLRGVYALAQVLPTLRLPRWNADAKAAVDFFLCKLTDVTRC